MCVTNTCVLRRIVSSCKQLYLNNPIFELLVIIIPLLAVHSNFSLCLSYSIKIHNFSSLSRPISNRSSSKHSHHQPVRHPPNTSLISIQKISKRFPLNNSNNRQHFLAVEIFAFNRNMKIDHFLEVLTFHYFQIYFNRKGILLLFDVMRKSSNIFQPRGNVFYCLM